MIPKCCCVNDCTYATDDYNRADGAMGASYTLLTGTAPTVASNELDFSTAGFVRHNTAYPGAATESRHASIRGKFSVAGGVELVVGLTDASNYFAASLTYSGSGCHILSASIVTAGVGAFGGGCTPTLSVVGCVRVPGLEIGDYYLLEVCLIPNTGSYGYASYDRVIAKVTLADGRIYSATLESEGPSVGDYGGVRSTVAHKFDDLKLTYFRDSPTGEHRICPNCRTPCFIGSDDFATDQPCNWQLISGSATRGSGVMTLTANGTRLTFNQFHPGLRTSFQQSFDFTDNGVTIRFYHGNGYAVLEYSAGTYTLTLYDNDANVLDDDEWDATADSGVDLHAVICYSRGVLSAQVTGHDGINLCVDSGIADTDDVELVGYWASVGGDNGAEIKNWRMDKTYNATAPADEACDGCSGCPVDCTACIDGTIEDVIIATIYDIAVGDGGDGAPPHYQCPWPMTAEDDSSVNGTSWACSHSGDNAFNGCCHWAPAGPTPGDGTIYRVWQSDLLIWNDCLHPCDTDPANGSDPCGSDECTGCGGLVPTSTELGYKRVMRLQCVNVCESGDVWATVLIWSGVFNPPSATAVQVQQIVTFKASLAGTAPYDCNGNLPLRLDFWGFDGDTDDCGSGATEGGGTDNGYYDWSNSYIIIENL